MNDELRSRILNAAAAAPSPTRAESRGRSLLALGLGALAGSAVFAWAGGPRIEPRPQALAAATFGLSLLLAWATLFIAFVPRRDMRPRGARRLVPLVFGAPLAWFAVKLSCTLPHAGLLAEVPERPGFRCLGLTLAVGAGLFAALVVLWRGRALAHVEAQGAALGAGAGMAAITLVDLWCPVGHPEHLVLGHVFPVLIFAGLGAVLGRPVLALRSRVRVL